MTNVVTFPGLGLEFELNRVAFTLFGKEIYWYGVIIACGFLLAVLFCYRWAYKFGVDREKLMDMLFFAVPACIIGARAYYVIFHPSTCFNADGSFSLYNTIAIWDGGLAIYGAIIMAVVTVAVYCKVRHQSFWDYADIGCYGVIIGQMIGRWGNFMNVEAFGGVTDLPWRMCSESIANYLWNHGYADAEVYQQVLDGTLGVHPTFFYESMWNLLGLILLILLARKGRKFSGQIFLCYVIWYGVGRTVIEGLRTDSLYFFGTALRTSQLVGILSAAAALVLLIVRARTAGPATPPLPKPGGEAVSVAVIGSEGTEPSEGAPIDSAQPEESAHLGQGDGEEKDGHDRPV